ncbi:MAG TPA: transcriptional repressor LexA [bacterium]|nr:transcriptional repressor LexA [bacterium]
MAKQLTERQRIILNFIHQYIQDHAYPPTFREIGQAINISSTKAVNDHLAVLERKGFIQREKNKSRAIHILSLPPEIHGGVVEDEARVLTVHMPVRLMEGAIAANPAGVGTYEDYQSEALPIDAGLFGGGPCMALKVTGDSMEGAHICDGDLAVIRKQEQVNNGDIAAVDLDGEVTLKYYKKQGPVVALSSANPAYETRLVDVSETPVRILGRFVGIIRNRV